MFLTDLSAAAVLVSIVLSIVAIVFMIVQGGLASRAEKVSHRLQAVVSQVHSVATTVRQVEEKVGLMASDKAKSAPPAETGETGDVVVDESAMRDGV